MARTVINLSDPVSTLVEKTNLISTHLGDITTLNTGAAYDSDIVQAINYVNEIVQKTDSADITDRIITTDYVRGKFQSDSANGIEFDNILKAKKVRIDNLSHEVVASKTDDMELSIKLNEQGEAVIFFGFKKDYLDNKF